MVSLTFLLARTILFTITNIFCVLSIATIIQSKDLRSCPIFCFIALADGVDIIRLIAIYFVHDLPSAIARYEVFEDTIGYVLFFILLRLICHFLILTSMSIAFVIGVISVPVFTKFARYRIHLVVSMFSISIIFASIAFMKEHWGRKFSMERLSFTTTRTDIEKDALNNALMAMKGTALFIVSVSATIILLYFCKVKRSVKIRKGLKKDSQEHDTLLVAGFFVLALFYFLPNLVLMTTQLAPNSIQTYEIVEMISSTIEFSKWILYSLSSKRFRAGLSSVINGIVFSFIPRNDVDRTVPITF